MQNGATPNIVINYMRIPCSMAVKATLLCWRNFIELLAEKFPFSLNQKVQGVSVLEVLDHPEKYADMLFPTFSTCDEYKQVFLQNAGELKRLVENLLSKRICPQEEILEGYSPQYSGSLRQHHKERQETVPSEDQIGRQPLLGDAAHLSTPTPSVGRE